jgi:phenylalanyl-tRNA synthetase beta chain
MLISRNWLQNYFEAELPSAQTLADTLMMHAFEIEEVYEKNNDWIIDIDVLPNRAHDCLCHFGIAQELSVLLNIPTRKVSFPEITTETGVSVQVLNTQKCTRYQAVRINNIAFSTEEYFEDFLSAMGQKSINNLVDISNAVMFDYGQPTHVFDADKIAGTISVRNAQIGEKMTTLSGEELELVESDLVISDEEGVLALAGVKGSTKAEVTSETKNIIVEVAHFNPVTTRKTARRVKILTDASKRYENEISAEKGTYAMQMMVALIQKFAGTSETSVIAASDIYPERELQKKVSVSLPHIQSLLGVPISEQEVSDIFDRLRFSYSQSSFDEVDVEFNVIIPFDRIDLGIAEDLIEEIGRIYGYTNIPSRSLDTVIFEPRTNKSFFGVHALTQFLIEQGFSDVMTYTFVKNGEVEMLNPLASDKKALRTQLHEQISEALERNMHHADYLGMDRIALFEIGHVYFQNHESNQCCIAVLNKNKSAKKKYGTEQEQLENIISSIEQNFNVSLGVEYIGNTVSFDMSNIRAEVYDFSARSYHEDATYHSVSVYPFVARDVSFWADSGKTPEFYQKIIKNAGADFLKKVFLFDEFEKDNKTSYAFSLVFQSNGKTLVDTEVESDMQKITQVLGELGCEVR